MAPLYFADDNLNYARYLLGNIWDACRSRYIHFSSRASCNWRFCSSATKSVLFSQTSEDQTNEQTVNRDSNTRDGQISFSNNVNAVHRWILSINQRAKISSSCTEIDGKVESCHKKKVPIWEGWNRQLKGHAYNWVAARSIYILKKNL